MSTIEDNVLKAFYKQASRRVLIFSLGVFLAGLGIGYFTGPLYPNLIAAAVIILLYVLLYQFKHRLASGTYPANVHERSDLNRFFAKNGGKIVPHMSLE